MTDSASAAPRPILTAILTAHGLEPAPYTAHSLPHAVAHEPDGVYTVARTFHGDRVQLLGAHLDRLEQSARLEGVPLDLDRGRLRAALRELLAQAGYADAKFRITVPRAQPDRIVFAVEPFRPVPADVLRDGAHLLVMPLVRQNPVAKTTAWMTQRRPAQGELPPEYYEGLLVDAQGYLLEGLSSNFYAVIDGGLRTAGTSVLEGITRRAILRIAPDLLAVRLDAVHCDELPGVQEAMITSSGRGVVPVASITDRDGVTHQPEQGAPGPVVRELMRRYAEWTESTLEPV